MTTTDRIGAAIRQALHEVSTMLPPGSPLPDGPEAPLLEAQGGPLDSLGVVNLMVAVEGAVNEEFGIDLSLAEFLADVPESSPFRSRQALQESILKLVDSHS